LISGWGLAGDGMGKISKSKGGLSKKPFEMINQYSADAIRYWAASTGPGKDSIISEEKIKTGTKLITKLWNVSRFSYQFITEIIDKPSTEIPDLSTADRWILSKLHLLIKRVTELYRTYDYAAAKAETEIFFWEFSDNYLEMAKQRLYDKQGYRRMGALFSIHESLLALIKLFAPILPHITEEIFQGMFIRSLENGHEAPLMSIHSTKWPKANNKLISLKFETSGKLIREIATAVRRYKSENSIPLGKPIDKIEIIIENQSDLEMLENAIADLKSVSRAKEITIENNLDNNDNAIMVNKDVSIAISP
jgi:valyl-tRNA synthetase